MSTPADESPAINLANDAIDFAHDAKIDIVDNYSALAAPPDEVSKWLDYARLAHVKVGINMTYFVDPTTDMANQQFYDHYGATLDDQVDGIVNQLKSDPSYDAVARFFVDERPGNSAMAEQFGTRLDILVARIKKLTDRPIKLNIEHGADDATFMASLKGRVDQLMPDYYPFPEILGPGGSVAQYGSIDKIREIARDVHAVFGTNGGMAVQGFSWSVNEPDRAKKYGFPAENTPGTNHGAPLVEDMVAMARMAIDEGVCHFSFFHLEYADAIGGQRQNIYEAAREIRPLLESSC
ncbi:MAG: hypothetical protein NVSMB39_1240 [Candidatus Saccharimonadales bacterium]